MEYSRIGDTCVVRMDKGENIMETLKALCAKEDIRLAQVDALGAVDHAEIGVFDPEQRAYCREELNEFLEITSLAGSVTRMDGQVYLHLHTTLAGQDHRVHGGHVIEMRVGLTCEMFVRVLPGELTRRPDAELGINTIRF